MIGYFSCLGDVGNNEDCATVKTDGQWNDIPCVGYSYGSICEVGKYVNAHCNGTVGTFPQRLLVKTLWLVYKGFAYLIECSMPIVGRMPTNFLGQK